MSKNDEKRLPDDVVEANEATTPEKEEVEVSEEKSNIERWWTKEGPTHSIVGKLSPDAEPSMVSMKGYVMELDISTPKGKQLSNDFRLNQYVGISVFLIVPIDESSIEKKNAARNFRKVIDTIVDDEKLRGLKHVAAIFTEEEARELGINRHHPDRPELIRELHNRKSFLPKSEYKNLHKI